jgi:integration host factor subunit alpha
MTLTKSDIVRHVRENVRLKKPEKEAQIYLFPEMDCVFLSRNRAARIVGSLMEIIKAALVKGQDVRIFGFGKFQVKFKWARSGRNPRTGERIILRSRRVVTFRPFRKLRDRINRRR